MWDLHGVGFTIWGSAFGLRDLGFGVKCSGVNVHVYGPLLGSKNSWPDMGEYSF